jgi:RimJ/RimL family protein N-acetyltransferase
LNLLTYKPMLDFNVTLETEEILLRPLISDDFLSFEKLSGDESMWVYFTNDLSVQSDLQEWVENALTDIKAKNRLAFTIIDKSAGKPIGSTSFGNISYRDKRIEIGWTWICKQFQGTHVNNQIKYLMIKYVFDTLDFERVEIKTDVLNIAARKALVRIGARDEGILRSHTLMSHGRRRDTIYYSILKTEWPDIKRKNNWQ